MYGNLSAEFYDSDKKFASVEEVGFYKSLFKTDQLILEPMCGSGRLLIPLMQEGYNLHGIDRSPHMLNNCKNRALHFGLKPLVFESDINTIVLKDRYDGIIIPFGSFQLLYPRNNAYQLLQKIKTLLKPSGKLVFDLFVPWEALYKDNQEIINAREIKTNENSVIQMESHSIANKEEQFIASTVLYKKYIDQQIVSHEIEHMYLTWFYRYEMELILEKFGFKNIQCQNRFFNDEALMTFVAEMDFNCCAANSN